MESRGDQVVEDGFSDQEEESFYQDIDLLQNHGINVADIKKLKSAGICTIKGVQMTTRRKMCQIKGISEAKMEKIKEAAAKLANAGFVTALEYSDIRKMVFRISTGSAELDRPDRLREIADRFNLDQNAMLDNVLYCRAYTSEHQYELMDCVAAKFHEEPGVFKLMIIDSIMALFRVDFCGRGELADRQQKLAQMLSRLQKLSEEFNVAVFITNQMTADPGGWYYVYVHVPPQNHK
ncbi:Meiotic recombination protein DMC1/LIM15-like protein [Acropora cervicornis]|uniref:Meiotic recombination protein DMC1/LIM15-like protein n=1 Tax=Acropora cervicornis TaxID=6130 RepID=A0AAD9Q9D9_ACRCE|nr:Meiotic recombination protein DMC1/LIM15-like protein [Acropora cervicornis]